MEERNAWSFLRCWLLNSCTIVSVERSSCCTSTDSLYLDIRLGCENTEVFGDSVRDGHWLIFIQRDEFNSGSSHKRPGTFSLPDKKIWKHTKHCFSISFHGQKISSLTRGSCLVIFISELFVLIGFFFPTNHQFFQHQTKCQIMILTVKRPAHDLIKVLTFYYTQHLTWETV